MGLDESEAAGAPEQEGQKTKSRDYWSRWIVSAKKAAEAHWKDARSAWAEFEHKANPEEKSDGEKTASYPIYWSSVKTIEPAYYSRTPKVTTTRRFEIDDDVAATSCLISERLGQYLFESFDIDSVFQSAVGEFIHADKATVQLIYNHDVEVQPKQVALIAGPDGSFMLEDGTLYPDEVFQDPQTGAYFGMQNEEVPVNKKITLAPVSFDDILHTPDARTTAEIKELGLRFSLSEAEAKKRFGEKANKILWKTTKGEKEEKNQIPGKWVEGWEIYCLEDKNVYWYSEQYVEDLLDVQHDPYQLRGFFPCPSLIIGSKPRKDLYPTPAYIHCKDAITALHEQAYKVYELMDGIRRRALVDGSMPELIAALQDSGDNEFIAVKNISAIVEKGGLANVIQYVPVQELVDAITELSALEEKFKQSFYEWFGVPDILRGASDPVETAAAQEVKAASAHDRFKYQKKQVAQLVRDSADLMLDLALGVFSEDEIKQIVGFDYLSQEHQARFADALALLKNDEVRLIRVDIDTDTMSFLDQALRQQKVGQATATVTEGLKTIAEMSQGDPTFLPTGLQTVLLSLESIDAGRQFEDGVKKAVQSLIEAKQNPPQEPPPPDYEQMKLDLQAQKQNTDAAFKAKELEQKELKLSLDAQKAVSDKDLESFKAQTKAQIDALYGRLEEAYVEIERFKAENQARESAMEEVRLARESDVAAMQGAIELTKGQKEEGEKEGEAPQITIINAPGGMMPGM